MKRNIIKVLSGLLIITSLFSVSASANEYSGWRTNTIFYSGEPITVYADSSQWENRYDNTLKEYYWVCATQNFQQGYCDAWINTNGKWYYVGDDGRMRTDTLVGSKYKKERYMLDANGVMEVNTDWDQFGYLNHIDNNGLVHLPDTYYKMMPNDSNIQQTQYSTVPNLFGLDTDTAKDMLSKYNLKTSVAEKETQDESKNGTVLSQNYEGTRVQQGTTVTIVVGKYVAKQEQTQTTNSSNTDKNTGTTPGTGITNN